jgi:hypothetical protein
MNDESVNLRMQEAPNELASLNSYLKLGSEEMPINE